MVYWRGGIPRRQHGRFVLLGVDIPPLVGDGAEVRIQGVGLRGLQESHDVLDFENSGTGARLMLGVLAGQPMTGDRDRGRVPTEPSDGEGDRSRCPKWVRSFVRWMSRIGFLSR